MPSEGTSATSSLLRASQAQNKQPRSNIDPSSSSSTSLNYGTVSSDPSRMEGADTKVPFGSDPDHLDSPRKDDDEMLAGIRDSEGTSLYEKKCMVVNREIDRMGMGKYQWCIWGLCGFGYLLDLMWAQVFGLILGPLGQEFGFGANQSGEISTAFSAGLCAGAAFWGILVDIIGRKWAFNLTALISSAFGLGLGGAPDYKTFLVLAAFTGIGVGGNIPIDTTITLEAIPQRHRRLLPFLSIFQPIGVVLCTAIAYGFIPDGGHCVPAWTGADALPTCKGTNLSPPACCGKGNNMGWRYTLFTVGAITLGCFILRFVVFRFRESPKFLLYRGHDDQAAEVLQQIAKFNGQESHVTLATFDALTEESASLTSNTPILGGGKHQSEQSWGKRLYLELDRYKILFSTPTLARVTTLVWLTYFCDYWGFTLAGTFLPTVLSKKNAALNLSIKYTYRSYLAIYTPGIAGVLLGVLCYDLSRTSRKWTMVASSGLMAASLFIFATVNSQASNIGLNFMEYFFQSMFNAVLYGWTPEAFPAPIRGTASGVASFWGRLAGIVAPLAGQTLISPDSGVNAYTNLLYLAGGVTMACVLFTALLPNKLVGRESM